METRYIPSLDKKISLLGFGCMRLPLLTPGKSDIDYAVGREMIDMAMQAGVNYYDTAWPYHEGKSELFIGEALKSYPRESFYLADKFPTWEAKSPDDVEKYLTEQLKKCQVEYFDFYLIHNLFAHSYNLFKKHEIYDRAMRLKEQGLIRHLGFSFHDHPKLLREIVRGNDWEFAQIQLNYLDWTDSDAAQQYEILHERKIPVAIMEPLRGGALSRLNPAATAILHEADPAASNSSWALRYAASLPGLLTVLSGMSHPDHVADNLKTMSPFRPLNDEERDRIEKAAAAYRSSGTIGCTGCRYCMDCPSGVDIPRVFAIYNQFKINPVGATKLADYLLYRTLDEGCKADNCTSCGQCMEHCPQSLEIPKLLAEISAE